MTWHRREAAERFAERRRRENEAPRLLSVVPTLSTLRITLEELRGKGTLVESRHVRAIVVNNAPALFVFPCQDAACKEGGHDMTAIICRSLRAGEVRFEGDDPCHGQIGTTECGRVLKFVAEATYKA